MNDYTGKLLNEIFTLGLQVNHEVTITDEYLRIGDFKYDWSASGAVDSLFHALKHAIAFYGTELL